MVPGLVDFIPAVALTTSASTCQKKFSQPGDHFLGQPCRGGTGSRKFESEVSTANISRSHSLDRECHWSTLILNLRCHIPSFSSFKFGWLGSAPRHSVCMHARAKRDDGSAAFVTEQNRRKVGEAESHALRSCVPFARLTRSRTGRDFKLFLLRLLPTSRLLSSRICSLAGETRACICLSWR